MQTKMTILGTSGDVTVVDIDLSAEPGYNELRSILKPVFEDANYEHVSVLQEGERRCMFVDEIGHQKGLPENRNATAIYRANALSKNPDLNPETLPHIVGVAVVFDRRVWF